MKLQKMKHLLLPATMIVSLALCGTSAASTVVVPAGPGQPEVVTGTQITQIEGYDWGPGVSKTIITLNRAVMPDSVSAEKFSVIENKENYNYAGFAQIADKGAATHVGTESERTVVNAYTCDENGNRVAGSSSYIALELRCTPSEGAPFCYDVLESQNSWCDYYGLDVSLRGGCSLDALDGASITELRIKSSIDFEQSLFPDLAGVDLSGTFAASNGDKMTYASYRPVNASAGNKRPLVIWLHGAGEGGKDPRIALLGNKVTALVKSAFQDRMGGAFVLVPQIPDFWMTYDSEGNWKDNPGVDSVHLFGLKELIDQYVSANPDIDRSRILIGGCSNGGYMTMDMIMNYPDYFAAAFPICEAYKDAGITDARLWAISNTPVWFVYAENDTTVDPALHEVPTINRLRSINSRIHTSVFADVHDTTGLYNNEDGSAHQYSGHWSWLYFFNDQCADGKTVMWNWLSRQKR